MHPCTRVGIDITWRCNWNCRHCFYRRNPKLHASTGDVSLSDITVKIDKAKAGGLDHVVMVGYGEPSLAPELPDILEYCQSHGMATSMITNGATGLDRYKSMFAQGMDHLHISSHGLGDTLDNIAGVPGAFKKQAELKQWLTSSGMPFRTNVTLQQKNYQQLPELVEYEVSHGVFHFVFLGFLPHYEWGEHLREVAVHPAALRPYIETAADVLLDAGTYFTIRYHPLCHLSERYWPYVVNARYVLFDPWEWNYELQANDRDSLWKASVKIGEATANTDPCRRCSAYRHCGGWNQRYADAFDGAALTPIDGPPTQYQDVWQRDGGLHDLNPVNALTGTTKWE